MTIILVLFLFSALRATKAPSLFLYTNTSESEKENNNFNYILKALNIDLELFIELIYPKPSIKTMGIKEGHIIHSIT